MHYRGFIWDYDGSIREIQVDKRIVSAETWLKVTWESFVPTEGERILITPWNVKQEKSLGGEESSMSPLKKESVYQFTEKEEEKNEFDFNLMNDYEHTPNRSPSKLIEKPHKNDTKDYSELSSGSGSNKGLNK